MSEPTQVNRRRSTRLSIAIPIFISGTNSQGMHFREKARTLVVNKHGAKIATAQPLAHGAEIVIENPAVGVTARALVLLSGYLETPDGSPAVAVQLFEAQNIWGIQFPPGDWE